MDFWECSTEGNIVDNPFEYHGGEGLIDARIYFPPGNGNGRNVSTDPLLKACPEQSQVGSGWTYLVDNVDAGVLQGQVRKTETFFDLRFLVDFLGQTCQRFPGNQVHVILDLKTKLENVLNTTEQPKSELWF